MTELIQPLSDAPLRQVPAQPRTPARTPSFSELVYAHHDWWKARKAGPVDPAATAEYDAVRTGFEDTHGQIVRAYWCSHVASAVALTERKKRFGGLLAPSYGFHRETDWATKNAPDVTTQLHRCDELAVRAKAVLTGVRQRICLELVVSCAAHLLSLVDEPAVPGDAVKAAAALDRERDEIDNVESYYCQAANGQAQLVYFGGIATVTLTLAAICTPWLALSWSAPVAALAAGAVGAVVSVIQRINSGTFELEYDVGRPYAFFLGGLRPLIGGAFAMAITFAFDGGLLHLPVEQHASTGDRHLALLVLAFLAGFSERWAQDTLTSVLPGAAEPKSSAQSPPPPEKGAARE